MANSVFPLNSLDSKPTCSAYCSISVNGSLQVPLLTLWSICQPLMSSCSLKICFAQKHRAKCFSWHHISWDNSSVLMLRWHLFSFASFYTNKLSWQGRQNVSRLKTSTQHQTKFYSFLHDRGSINCNHSNDLHSQKNSYSHESFHHVIFSISHRLRTKGMLVNIRTERVNGPVLLSRAVILEEQKNDMRPNLNSCPSLPKQQMQAPPLPNLSQPYHILAIASHGASSPQSAGSRQWYWHCLACRGQRLDLLTVSSAEKRQKRKSLLFMTENKNLINWFNLLKQVSMICGNVYIPAECVASRVLQNSFNRALLVETNQEDCIFWCNNTI